MRVLEARSQPGGLASALSIQGFSFDAGPYLLLDQPGLAWAFEQLGFNLDERLALRRIEHIYSVTGTDQPPVSIQASLEETARRLDADWPGAGSRYRRLMTWAEKGYQAFSPLQRIANPGPRDLLQNGRWQWLPFLASSLSSVLRASGLPEAVQNAVGIWTHVAGESLRQAPSPLLFLPALMHSVGAFYPAGGIGAVAGLLAAEAETSGVRFEYGQTVTHIGHAQGQVTGVTLAGGEFFPADAVVANAAALDVCLNLLDTESPGMRRRLEHVRLQSPGVCAYLAVRVAASSHQERRHSSYVSPYVQFHFPGTGQLCRFLVQPCLLSPELEQDGWQPVRLLAPMHYNEAEQAGQQGQQEYLKRLLDEPWWQKDFTEIRVLDTCLPGDWGTRFHLYRDSMNPVMTARWMGFDHFSQRSSSVAGLYLCGSGTYPGYSVSFCTISGILAAGQLEQDYAKR